MNDQTDQSLLQAYAANRSETAFAELVRRYVDLVYSAAFRMVGDSQHAEDVTQAVFAALAQNARQLASHTLLSGWLHRTTRNLAANTIRTNSRRQKREQEAVTMNQLLASGNDHDWQNIAPQLDSALDELPEADREALLLRYFEKKSAAEMALRLGISDDTAQKRVSRAVDRLREIFAQRKITIGASGLILILSANAVTAAPAGLAVAITGAVLATAAISTTATMGAGTASATKAIAMTTLQKTVIVATLAAVTGTGLYEAVQNARLQQENEILRQKQTPLSSQIAVLMQERDDATNRLAGLTTEVSQLRSNSDPSELLRLRGQVGVLKQQLQAASQPHSSVVVPAQPASAAIAAGIPAPAVLVKKTYSSFDLPAEHPDMNTSGVIDLKTASFDQVLNLYRNLSKRTVLRGSLPDGKITLSTQSPISQIQMLQMLDTALAENGVAMVVSGDMTVKAVPIDRLQKENLPEIDLPWDQLPDSSSPMTRTVQLKNVHAVAVIPDLAPLAKLPGSLMAIQDKNLLVIRDYSANIKQQLKLLETLDQKPAH